MGQTLKLTNRDLVKLDNALRSLDGSKQGKDEIMPFEFAPAVSWKLSKNAVIVERAKLAYDKAVRMQARQLGILPGESITVGGDKAPDAEKLAKFLKHDAIVEELKDQETEITGILCITLDELLKKPADGEGKVKTNPIPQSVRNGLVPIITEEAAK